MSWVKLPVLFATIICFIMFFGAAVSQLTGREIPPLTGTEQFMGFGFIGAYYGVAIWRLVTVVERLDGTKGE